MKIQPKFIQRNCTEGDRIDLRQANAIQKYKPDIIIFEMPQGKNGPNAIFNKYSCNKKPVAKVYEMIKSFKESAKTYPYAESDIYVWENIVNLWKQGINTMVYNVDALPLLRHSNIYKNKSYNFAKNKWVFWVYLYLRDIHMANNVRIVLSEYNTKEKPVVLVAMQSIHWEHIQFLLKTEDQNKIRDYYFGRFPKLDFSTFEIELKKESKTLYNFWIKSKLGKYMKQKPR